MFIRKKLNQSGSTSIQILRKEKRRTKLVETIACVKTSKDVQRCVEQAQQRLLELNPQQSFDLFRTEKDQTILDFFEQSREFSIKTIGPELVLGKIFDNIGLNVIPEKLFRHMVIARLVHPSSKLKTIEYLLRYEGISYEVSQIYRFLDRLNQYHKETVERIVYEYTKKILKNISVVFYDMTTLYFESEDEDDLRRIGFSKDGKFQNPQIMLGLLVGEQGYPIGYDIFEGNTFEGHTLMPILEKIKKKYSLGKPIVIADAGLLSKQNLANLAEQEYQFIIGARIKNESNETKANLIAKAWGARDSESFELERPDGTRLIVTYTDKRARKDAYNREKGLRKLRQQVKTGQLTKKSINNRGYNKFLKLTGRAIVELDEEKITADKAWDGLKGYLTNTKLKPREITENYSQLWQIEKAFRISKTDLRIRPIFHQLRRRIEAHICIAFVAYTIYKELERNLIQAKSTISSARAIDILKSIYQIQFKLPDSQKNHSVLANLSAEQASLLKIFGFG